MTDTPTITDEHRARARQYHRDHYSGEDVFSYSAKLVAQIEQDTARRCRDIADTAGHQSGAGRAMERPDGTMWCVPITPAGEAIRAAFNIKD